MKKIPKKAFIAFITAITMALSAVGGFAAASSLLNKNVLSFAANVEQIQRGATIIADDALEIVTTSISGSKFPIMEFSNKNGLSWTDITNPDATPYVVADEAYTSMDFEESGLLKSTIELRALEDIIIEPIKIEKETAENAPVEAISHLIFVDAPSKHVTYIGDSGIGYIDENNIKHAICEFSQHGGIPLAAGETTTITIYTWADSSLLQEEYDSSDILTSVTISYELDE